MPTYANLRNEVLVRAASILLKAQSLSTRWNLMFGLCVGNLGKEKFLIHLYGTRAHRFAREATGDMCERAFGKNQPLARR